MIVQGKAPPAWLKLVPTSLRAMIERRSNLLEILSNTGWLFGDHILRMGVGLLVGVWVARYLGPEQFGLLNYAMAFVALFGAIASLGLNGIVVRDLVREPETADTTLGTAFLLQALGGLLAFALAVATISFIRPEDTLAKLMVAVLGFIMVFKATEVVKYWFESQVKSKYTVWVENGAFLLFAAVKVALILSQAPLIAFVWAAFAEGLLVAAGLLLLYYYRVGNLKSWRFRKDYAVVLIKDSWPLLFTGAFVLAMMNIDKIIIGLLTSPRDVGLYAAVITLVGASYIIPLVVGSSVAPLLTRLHTSNIADYVYNSQVILNLLTIIAIGICIPTTLFSRSLLELTYGSAFVGVNQVLAISIWSLAFVYHISLRTRLLIIEKQQKTAAALAGLTLITNIFANVGLIPWYGIIGAAYASLFSWMMCALIFPLFFRGTRVFPKMFLSFCRLP